MKNKQNRWTIPAIIVLVIITISIVTLYLVKDSRTSYKVDYAAIAQYHYYSVKDELINQVQSYIDNNSKNSNLTSLVLVDKCEEYDVDLIFVLAQGHLESNFGTEGLAKRTNSVWNQGAFDGDSFDEILNIYKYSHPDLSLDPYLKLLTKCYLVDKTELDLMENFINIRGERYASSQNYETRLKFLYEKIKTTTPIDSLQNKMRYWELRCNH